MKALIVEDDRQTSDHLQAIFMASERFETVLTADTVSAARDALRHGPDLLAVDIMLPDGNGIDLIRQVRSQNSDCKILMISVLGDEKSVLSALAAGADGYLLKEASLKRVSGALDDVFNGIAPISPSIAGHLLAHIRGEAVVPVLTPASDMNPLTARQQDVLEYLAKGFTYREISEMMSVQFSTVNAHVKAIYGKLGVHSKNEAVYEAVKSGLLRF